MRVQSRTKYRRRKSCSRISVAAMCVFVVKVKLDTLKVQELSQNGVHVAEALEGETTAREGRKKKNSEVVQKKEARCEQTWAL